MSLYRKPFSYTYNAVVFALIAVNLAAYIFSLFYPMSHIVFGMNFYGLLHRHWWWQPFTYMFMHGSSQHLLFNMLGLGFFGIMVEKAIGSKEFLLFYFICGLLCGLASMLVYYFTGLYGVTLIGASGAIYAVLLLYATVFPTAQVFVFYIIPIPAPLLVVLYTIIALFSQIFGFRTGVAHSAHLFGFVFAYFYIKVRMGISPLRIWKDTYRR